MLGLTTQVPAKNVYLTNGSTRQLDIGGQEIILKHTGHRNLVWAGTPVGDVFQALRFLGPSGVDDVAKRALQNKLDLNDKAELRKHKARAPIWIQSIITEIAA